MNEAMLAPEEHVLSTLEKDGSRRWLKPRLSRGNLLRWRRIVAYVLIIIFTITPFIKVKGMPLILLDIPARRFTFFGFTFLPTDTLLLALFMVGLLVGIFLVTALFGRIWCGWACPQTVYMEFVFRPIERFFDGTVGRGGKQRKGNPAWKTAVKYLVYLIVCVYLANTFLAYFVGVDALLRWVRQSPLEHPVPFLVMGFITVAMMFDFCVFREQLCIIACPYGRFQSVLLDQNSLIVSYDGQRGEPRGKKRSAARGAAGKPVLGDCVDCGNCVTTCPTGIDIREGLQMECINCTQCIDACNLVMKKIGRRPNLIQYSSQAADRGQRGHLFRPRTIAYPLMLILLVVLFFGVLFSKSSFDVVVLRESGQPHTIADDGRVRNMLRLKLTNRTDRRMNLTAQVKVPTEVQIQISEKPFVLEPTETRTFHATVLAPRNVFSRGRSEMELQISNGQQAVQNIDVQLLGPY